MNSSELTYLLDDLCSRHGFCLPPDRRASFLANPPDSVEGFVAEVIRAERLSASALDKTVLRDLHASVTAAFEKAGRRGDV